MKCFSSCSPITPTAIIDPVLAFVGNIFGSSDPNAQVTFFLTEFSFRLQIPH